MIFVFKHMDRSEALEEATSSAIEGVLSKMSQQPTLKRAIFSVNSKFQSVHLSIHLKDGHQIELEQGEDNIYKSVDQIASKLERELLKHKNKVLARRTQVPKNINEEENHDIV